MPLLSLAEVKKHLNIPATDTTDDLELESWFAAITEVVERYTGKVYTGTEAETPLESHKKAAHIIMAHMWDPQRGGTMPDTDPYTTTTPNSFSLGFFIPNRAKELMGAQIPGIG